jgi:hypothetical protein
MYSPHDGIAPFWNLGLAHATSIDGISPSVCSVAYGSNATKYYCEGPAYDNFTERLLRYALKLKAEAPFKWGQRAFPLPANMSVLIFGNSHTRQMSNALICQYRLQIYWEERLNSSFDPTIPRDDYPRILHFKNNSTITVITNTALVYSSTKWLSNLESWLQRPFSSFDAIVMGHINGVESKLKFGHSIIRFSLARPELFDSPEFPVPTVTKLAEVYSGPVVAVPMFAMHGQDVKTHAEQAIDYRASRNRTANIEIVDVRRHIQNLGECASDATLTVGTCLDAGDNDGGRKPQEMHRCIGKKGGHPDLVAWDVIEHMYKLLE